MKSAAFLATACVLVVCAAPSADAAPGNPEIAFAMGMLWRVQDKVCPGITFDPVELGKTMKPRAMAPADVRRIWKADFDRGYVLAGEAISGNNYSEYCRGWVVDFFGGKKDIFGNVKTLPEAPVRGLTIRR